MTRPPLGQNTNFGSRVLIPTEASHPTILSQSPGLADNSWHSRATSSQASDHTENLAAPKEDATTNAGLAQPSYVFPTNLFADYQCIPPGSRNVFASDLSQPSARQYASSALVAQGQLETTGPYASAAAPLANTYSQPFSFTGAEYPATDECMPKRVPISTPTFNTPALYMPHMPSTGPYPIVANMKPDEYVNMMAAASQSAAYPKGAQVAMSPAAAPVNSVSCPNPGYPMFPPNYSSTAFSPDFQASLPSTVPLRQYSYQQLDNAYLNTRPLVQLQNGYAHGMPPAPGMNSNWNFLGPNPYSQPFMAPYPPPTLQNVYSQGLPMQNSFASDPQESLPKNEGSFKFKITTPANMNGTATRSKAQGPASFSSESDKPNMLSEGKRKRLPSTPELSPTPELPPSSSSTSTMVDIGHHVAPDPYADLSTGRDTGATEKLYICRWNGCQHVFSDVPNQKVYAFHLDMFHNFREATRSCPMLCQWIDSEGECGKSMLMQSIHKHVCETHLHSLEVTCTFCTRTQARPDNMTRHMLNCEPFAKRSDDKKKEWWEGSKLVNHKTFAWYLEKRELRKQQMRLKKQRRWWG